MPTRWPAWTSAAPPSCSTPATTPGSARRPTSRTRTTSPGKAPPGWPARARRLVVIDAQNIDDTDGAERPAHTLLLAAGIPIVEHLTGLSQLPAAGARFTALPLRIEAPAASPCAPSPDCPDNRLPPGEQKSVFRTGACFAYQRAPLVQRHGGEQEESRIRSEVLQISPPLTQGRG